MNAVCQPEEPAAGRSRPPSGRPAASSVPGAASRMLPRALLGTALLFTACTPAPPAAGGNAAAGPGPAPPAAETSVPVAAPAAAEGWLAVALPRRQVEVAAQTEGLLRSVAVDVGDRVRAGQPLAEIETRELAEQRTMARASLAALEAEVRRARVAHEAVRERYQRRLPHAELYSEEEMGTLQSQVEEAAAELDSAEARVAEGRSQIAQLDERLSRGVITAPAAGTVVERYLDPGALVRPGVGVMRLISSSGLVIRFAVPPDEAAGLRLGQAVRFRTDDLPQGVEATISRISPQVDVASEMVFLEAEVVAPPDAAGVLQPGLVGRVVATAPARPG